MKIRTKIKIAKLFFGWYVIKKVLYCSWAHSGHFCSYSLLVGKGHCTKCTSCSDDMVVLVGAADEKDSWWVRMLSKIECK